MKNKIVIVGAGGLGKEVAVLIENINTFEPEYEIAGFYDDHIPAGQKVWHEIKALGRIEKLNKTTQKTAVALALGDPMAKKEVIGKLDNPNLFFPHLIHPSTWIGDSRSIEIGAGTIIAANTSLTTNIKIGKFNLINLNVTIGHDVMLGDFTSVMPGANIAGQIHIGDQVLIGAGANIINGKKIGNQSKIGAGATVISDIPSRSTAVGVPAKIIKSHELEGI